MAEANEGDRDRRVASGFPDPEKVPGPTERLRELHGDSSGGPQTPKFGRASASTAATDDYVPMDEMLRGNGFSGGAADRVSAFARRLGDEAADRIRSELVRRGVAENAKTAGMGIGEIGLASVLGLGVLGGAATAMIAGLGRVMPVWAAGLVTAGAFGIPAGVLAARGARDIGAGVGALGASSPA